MKLVIDDLANSEIAWGDIYSLAWHLGCNIKYPNMEVNKYVYENLDEDIMETEEWKEEQARVDLINGIRLDNFNEAINNWMIAEGYIIED